ncbi:hypothetical protein AAG589_21145 [Isoptericola sp. F-RaC21]|uniref:hypothetical protein n=1 Tax=Isoptericola sp. F-RaC21 TaxID=3141452 RepID=UPI00315BA915
MSRRVVASLVVPVLVSAAVSGCAPSDAQVPVPSPTVSSGARPTPSASGEPMHEDSNERTEVREAPGEWGSTARASAVAAADAAMSAWADSHELSEQDWWAALAPTLSVGARSAYEGTDPANVPVRSADKTGRVAATPSVYLARVSYGTNDGEWLVTVSRTVGPAGEEVFAVERLQAATAGVGGERA